MTTLSQPLCSPDYEFRLTFFSIPHIRVPLPRKTKISHYQGDKRKVAIGTLQHFGKRGFCKFPALDTPLKEVCG